MYRYLRPHKIQVVPARQATIDERERQSKVRMHARDAARRPRHSTPCLASEGEVRLTGAAGGSTREEAPIYVRAGS